jgi:hypothetical protein
MIMTKEEKKKTQLVASAGSLDQLAKMIGNYFYSKEPFDLKPIDDKTYSVAHPASSAVPGKIIDRYMVVNKKGRFRFELLKE